MPQIRDQAKFVCVVGVPFQREPADGKEGKNVKGRVLKSARENKFGTLEANSFVLDISEVQNLDSNLNDKSTAWQA